MAELTRKDFEEIERLELGRRSSSATRRDRLVALVAAAKDCVNMREKLVRSDASRLAMCMGVYDAATTDMHLGEAAPARGFKSRTYRGDAYETGFEWARGEAKDRAGMGRQKPTMPEEAL